jgi:3-hydroxyisobutyrate dehydrogenase-like beta-hydroxyacid dehydrogenase
MGAAMAGRLIDAGEHVAVWNRTKAKTQPLTARGASTVDTVAELGSCDIVFVMVSTEADLDQVITGPDGLLSASRPPEVIVDCSTVSVAASTRIRAAAHGADVEFLAAPISGNPHVVADGQACLVVSGPEHTYRQVLPHLQQIAPTVVFAGEQEQSRLVKLCSNLYLGMMVQALVEVTSLAEKAGTSRAAFLDFLNGTVLSSDWVRRRSPDLVARDWTPTFTTALLRKDFDLGLDAARQLEVPMPVAASVQQLIQSAIGYGLRDEDFLSLYEVQAQAADLPPKDPSGQSAE